MLICRLFASCLLAWIWKYAMVVASSFNDLFTQLAK